MIDQIHPLKLFEMWYWIDGRRLIDTIESYRRDIFSEFLFTLEPDGTPKFNTGLFSRGKKNWKSSDMIFAGLYRLVGWKTQGGNDCLAVANDLEQAKDDLDLLKKIVKVNPMLRKALKVKENEVSMRDGSGYFRILSGKDTSGQHGKSFNFLGVDELHGQKDWSLLEGLQLDPHRRDAAMWLTSYDTLLRRPGVPIFDLLQKAKHGAAGRRFYISWYGGDYCSDPVFARKSTPEERANPSLGTSFGTDYIEQQRGLLPWHLYKRLHQNVGGQPTGSAFAAESIINAIDPGVRVRPPVAGINYVAACDMSDGSNDDSVLSIGHVDQDNRAVLDLVMDQQAGFPFDPLKAVKLFASVLHPYTRNLKKLLYIADPLLLGQ